MPRALDFSAWGDAGDLEGTEELYLKWTGSSGRAQGKPTDEADSAEVAKETPSGCRTSLKVAVLVDAPGQNRRELRFFLKSLRRNFLPGVEKRIFVFTDGGPVPGEDVTVIPVKPNPQPGRVNPERYQRILDAEEEFAGYDLLFSMKPQLRVMKRISEDEILAEGLVACLHSAYEDTPRAKIRFEQNEQSVTWVRPGDGRSYFCGTMQGGSREAFLQAVHTMGVWAAQDQANKVTPYWGDESYWNRYLIDRPPERTLGAEYAWRVTTQVPRNGSPKIHVLQESIPKNTAEERNMPTYPQRHRIAPRERRIEPVVNDL
jgi:hypothetical protein